MPIIDGKVVRARYTSLSLNEVSSVDNPAQPGALASICKRFVPASTQPSWLAREVAKYVSADDGAHTFNEVLSENKFDEQIWPMTDAFTQSIRSIMGDDTIAPVDRDGKVAASVDQFLTAVRALDPPSDDATATPIGKIESQLLGLISKKEPKTMKTVADLEIEVSALKAQVGTLTGERDTAVAAKTTAETAKTTAETAKTTAETAKAAAETERDTAKAALIAATDEVLTVDGTEIRKSAVGEASFAVNKALLGRAETAELEKRAATDFSHLPGTATEKALALKHIQSLPADDVARKAVETIMVSAERMAAKGFERIGYGGQPEDSGDVQKAKTTFSTKVAEIAKRDGIPTHDAMSKARLEDPEAFAAAYPEQAR